MQVDFVSLVKALELELNSVTVSARRHAFLADESVGLPFDLSVLIYAVLEALSFQYGINDCQHCAIRSKIKLKMPVRVTDHQTGTKASSLGVSAFLIRAVVCLKVEGSEALGPFWCTVL